MCNANLSADAQSGGLLYLKIVRAIGGTTTQLNESTSTDTYVHAHAEIEANDTLSYVNSTPLNLQIIDNKRLRHSFDLYDMHGLLLVHYFQLPNRMS